MDIQLGKRRLRLTERVGKVTEIMKHTTQQTHVSRGPSTLGVEGAVSVSSYSTVHDTMLLVDRYGNEFSLKLQNVDIPARKDQLLHCVWATPEGKEETLVGVFNRNTRETYWMDANLTKMFRLSRPLWKALVVVFVLTFIIGMLLASVTAGLGILLPFAATYLFWQQDKRSTAHVEELKSLISQGFQGRAGEPLVPAEPASA